METYGFPFHAIINEATLADHLFSSSIGHFGNAAFRQQCTVFEPALDKQIFYPSTTQRGTGPRRLLVYARPSTPRNMLGLAVAALNKAAASGAFAGNWEFLTLGAQGRLPDMSLGQGRVLRNAPWRDYTGYADLLRTSDILLCPMLSPHTSYPALEMVACGGLTVTNVFSTKTAERLVALCPNIIPVAPTIEGFTEGIVEGIERITDGRDDYAPVSSPATWNESLDAVYRMVRCQLYDK
jgi:hypothetical protein